jgi:putative flavoprotein involved in K+ transport
MDHTIETIIVGGGQGGLAVSYFLTQLGHEHVVLEAAQQPASAWRQDRWDSFTLVSPNWSFRLPGAEYSGPDPYGYMPRQEVVSRFEEYIESYSLPVEYGARVVSVVSKGAGYHVAAECGYWNARNVVVATGLFQKPKIPAASAGIDRSIEQLSSGRYRRPELLPPGAVLVVGSGQSGCQIADELRQAGRQVYLCVGSAGRAPRRYRGRDIFDWLYLTNFLGRTPAQLPSPQARFAANPQLTGRDGGQSFNLYHFHQQGVTLLGRFETARDGRVFLAPGLRQSLAGTDTFEANLLKMIDQYIAQNGIEAPEEQVPQLQDGSSIPEVLSLDLRQAGISTVIWALGYTFNFELVYLPVLDETGFPHSNGGVTIFPGLYFAGLPWLPGQKSGLLVGVGETAEHVADHIHRRHVQ